MQKVQMMLCFLTKRWHSRVIGNYAVDWTPEPPPTPQEPPDSHNSLNTRIFRIVVQNPDFILNLHGPYMVAGEFEGAAAPSLDGNLLPRQRQEMAELAKPD